MNGSRFKLSRVDFGNEAGDDRGDDSFDDYFVEQETFDDFLAPRKRLQVITARKGVGKSALLRWTAQKAKTKSADDLVISTRGADLVRNKFRLTSTLETPNDYISDWMVRLCALVNRALALEIGFAANDDDITLVETAEIEGYKSRNLIGCLIDRLQTLLEKGRTTSKISIADEAAVLKRVRGQWRTTCLDRHR